MLTFQRETLFVTSESVPGTCKLNETGVPLTNFRAGRRYSVNISVGVFADSLCDFIRANPTHFGLTDMRTTLGGLENRAF